MFRWLAWLLERDVPPMSTPTQERDRVLTVGEIDDVLKHWARKIHTDPDPINRWAAFDVCNRWLDARLALEHQRDQEPEDK